jgi:hypothetical protein
MGKKEIDIERELSLAYPSDSLAQAEQRGRMYYSIGITKCPYRRFSKLAEAWQKGYEAAQPK